MSLTYRQERERALAAAKRLQKALEHLVDRPEHIEGSPPGEALGYIDDAIGMLEPDHLDMTSNGNLDPSYLIGNLGENPTAQ